MRGSIFSLATLAALTLGTAALAEDAPWSGGYGGFTAYVVDLDENEVIAVRAEARASSDEVGVIPANAEGVYVNWCDKFGEEVWCLVEYDGLGGWIAEVDNLRNVESGD